MYNLTDDNYKKKPPFNHEKNKPERTPVTQECSGQNRKTTIRHVDNTASYPPTNSPSNDPCPSTPVQQRETKTQQYVNYVIHKDNLIKIKENFDNSAKNQNGADHCMFAKSVKHFTCKQQPLDTPQHNQLLLFLETHHPTLCWDWPHLTATFHAWASVNLLTPKKCLDPKPKKIQESLLKAFLGQVLDRRTNNSLPLDMTVRCTSTMMHAMAKMLEKELDMEKTPHFKTAATVLWLHVETQAKSQTMKHTFDSQIIPNLLWSMGKMGMKWLYLEQTPELKRSVAVLCDMVAKENPDYTDQGLANALWSFPALMSVGLLEDAPMLNKSVAVLLPLIDKKKDLFTSQGLSNLLWSLAELKKCMLLYLANTRKLQRTVVTLLLVVETKVKSRQQRGNFTAQDIASMLRSITKMIELELLEDTHIVSLLCPLVLELKNQFNLAGIGNLLWSAAKLGEMGSPHNLQDAVVTLLLRLEIKAKSEAKKDHFNHKAVANALYSTARLVDIGQVKDTTILNSFVCALWPLVAKQKDQLSTPSLCNIMWATAKLEDSGLLDRKNTRKLGETVVMLLPIMLTKVKSKICNPLEIANALYSITKLEELGQLKDKQKLNLLVSLLLPLITEQKNSFVARSLVNLMWAVAKLMDCVLMEQHNIHKLDDAVLTLLPLLKTKAESKEKKDRFNQRGVCVLLSSIAKLVFKGIKINIPDLTNFVATLLSSISVSKKQLTPHAIASLLYSIATLGEIIEIQRAITLSVSLINLIDKYEMWNKKSKCIALWGMLACRARSLLSGSADESHTLQQHIKQLFNHIKIELSKNETLEDNKTKTVMIQASAWLGQKCSASHNYEIDKSKIQCKVYKALSERFPSLRIEEEINFHALPPVDLYLPEHRLVIEVHGPYHYAGGDFQTRSGATLLKTSLLKKLRYDVIELPIPVGYESRSIQGIIDIIQKKIPSLEAMDPRSISPTSDSGHESSDDEYFTANEDNDSSDKPYSNDTNLLTETEKQTAGWKVVGQKNKKKRVKKAKK